MVSDVSGLGEWSGFILEIAWPVIEESTGMKVPQSYVAMFEYECLLA